MAGDLNESGLFSNRKVSTQENSVLQERWQQDGSSIFSIVHGTTGADELIYTVTAQKRLYITQLIISCSVAETTSGSLKLRDNGVTGTLRFVVNVDVWAAGRVEIFNFLTPLLFDVDLYLDVFSLNGSYDLNFVGWEE